MLFLFIYIYIYDKVYYWYSLRLLKDVFQCFFILLWQPKLRWTLQAIAQQGQTALGPTLKSGLIKKQLKSNKTKIFFEIMILILVEDCFHFLVKFVGFRFSFTLKSKTTDFTTLRTSSLYFWSLAGGTRLIPFQQDHCEARAFQWNFQAMGRVLGKLPG